MAKSSDVLGASYARAVAIGISLAASSYLTGMAMAGHLSVYAKWLIPIGQLIFQSIILAALYKYVPNCRVLWRDALVGGSLIALVFTVFRWGFGIYVMRGSYTTIYGAFAAIPVLLTWMYINWMFVLAALRLPPRFRCCAPDAIKTLIRAETTCCPQLPSSDPHAG